MKRYIAVLEIEDDCEIVGDIEAHVNYTYRVNGTYYRTDESVEFKVESEVDNPKEWPHKPCINYADGCEEWAGCSCMYYKAKSEVENGNAN